MKAKPSFHGSDIEKISAYYGIRKETIVNFAANVNPLGLSPQAKKAAAEHIDLFGSYPDREYSSLRRAISDYCHVPAKFILPGNGASELIGLLIAAVSPKRTLILGPTYSEYARELSFTGSTKEYYSLREEDDFRLDIPDFSQKLSGGFDLLILCNPNNPTSSAVLHAQMEELLSICRKKNVFVMVDETYVEFAPDIRNTTAVSFTREYENLAVLRGVSKFYAAPGMRLGYVICGNAAFRQQIKEKQTPWSLNSLAAFAGEELLRDEEYFARTRELILSERNRMYQKLLEMPGYKPYFPYANFIFARIQKEGVSSADVFETCIRQGLMIRDCSSFACSGGEYVRFCVMNPADNDRLLDALAEAVSDCNNLASG